jgi:hypothetical protein
MFICETQEGRKFSVVMKGTMQYRKFLLANIRDYLGKTIKVKFFSKTKDNIPTFPVGLCFRLESDIDGN